MLNYYQFNPNVCPVKFDDYDHNASDKYNAIIS